jgi:hypothetical protein
MLGGFQVYPGLWWQTELIAPKLARNGWGRETQTAQKLAELAD